VNGQAGWYRKTRRPGVEVVGAGVGVDAGVVDVLGVVDEAGGLVAVVGVELGCGTLPLGVGSTARFSPEHPASRITVRIPSAAARPLAIPNRMGQ